MSDFLKIPLVEIKIKRNFPDQCVNPVPVHSKKDILYERETNRPTSTSSKVGVQRRGHFGNGCGEVSRDERNTEKT